MAHEFKPSVGGAVSKVDAQKWIDKYDKEFRKEKDKDTRSIFYGRDILEKILAQPGCAGISFFLAMKYSDHAKKDTVHLVLVGTREDGSLIWPIDSAGKDGDDGVVADNGSTCPPFCPNTNG